MKAGDRTGWVLAIAKDSVLSPENECGQLVAMDTSTGNYVFSKPPLHEDAPGCARIPLDYACGWLFFCNMIKCPVFIFSQLLL